MQRTKITSSTLASVGYDKDAETLEVEFISFGIYQYLKVPLKVYEKLLSAPSKGRYFEKHIQDQFQAVKIR